MVTHRYHSLKDGKNKEVEEFLINHPYQCEIILTNITKIHINKFTLLYQIPNGSLPLNLTKYIDIKE
jgi:hypothetical protein